MNDFTKNELIEILQALKYWHEDMETRLHEKISTMIESYCEHESIYCKCQGQWVCDECHFQGENNAPMDSSKSM